MATIATRAHVVRAVVLAVAVAVAGWGSDDPSAPSTTASTATTPTSNLRAPLRGRSVCHRARA